MGGCVWLLLLFAQLIVHQLHRQIQQECCHLSSMHCSTPRRRSTSRHATWYATSAYCCDYVPIPFQHTHTHTPHKTHHRSTLHHSTIGNWTSSSDSWADQRQHGVEPSCSTSGSLQLGTNQMIDYAPPSCVCVSSMARWPLP